MYASIADLGGLGLELLRETCTVEATHNTAASSAFTFRAILSLTSVVRDNKRLILKGTYYPTAALTAVWTIGILVLPPTKKTGMRLSRVSPAFFSKSPIGFTNSLFRSLYFSAN